jgi:hypothetical protein
MSDASKPEKTEASGHAVGDVVDTVATKAEEAIEATQKAIHTAVDPVEPKSTSAVIVDDIVKLTNDVSGAVVAGSQALYDKVVGTGGEEPKK